MARQGYDLQLTRYDDLLPRPGWSIPDERDRHQLRTPWHATQRAAWEALKKAEAN
jgi:hypothetical protein